MRYQQHVYTFKYTKIHEINENRRKIKIYMRPDLRTGITLIFGTLKCLSMCLTPYEL